MILGADLVLDGADNFEVRYLVNEACVKHHVPSVYGGVLATYGLTAAVVRGTPPCLRCLPRTHAAGRFCAYLPERPGVLGPAVAVVCCARSDGRARSCSTSSMPFAGLVMSENI